MPSWTVGLARVVAAVSVAAALVTGSGPTRDEAPAAPAPVRFTEHLIQGGYGYAFGVAAADLDGDGHMDLTSCDTVGNALYWFAGDGKGGFVRHVIRKDEPGWFERHAVADLDGDGRPDVVVVKNQAAEIVWFANGGRPRAAGNWTRHVLATGFARAYDVAVADFSGDGRPDVAASAWIGNQIAWFENPGKSAQGEWQRHVIEDRLAETRTVRVADFNGDGRPDLLATASAAGLVVWYENPGPGGGPWARHVIDEHSPRPMHGHAVDVDGDGDPDVVMALGMSAPAGQKNTHQVVWYENAGKGRKWVKHVIGELDGAFEAVAADLNGDGKPDVVATGYGGPGRVVWFANPGDPKKAWSKHVLKEGWPRANQVIVADLDGDGRPDVIATAERGANELRWWRNEGMGGPRP
jgi:hypothetical protein